MVRFRMNLNEFDMAKINGLLFDEAFEAADSLMKKYDVNKDSKSSWPEIEERLGMMSFLCLWFGSEGGAWFSLASGSGWQTVLALGLGQRYGHPPTGRLR